MFKVIFFVFIFNFCSKFAFSANECSNDSGYVEKGCAALPIVPSYDCVLKNKDHISGICVRKAQDITDYCSRNQLLTCGTAENDKDNLFEICLSQYTDKCGDIGRRYL